MLDNQLFLQRNWHRQISLALISLTVFMLGACDRSRATAPPSNNPTASTVSSPTPAKITGPAAAVATTHYEAEGTVVSLDPKRPSIELDHDEIKDLMPAMKMEFYVKDKSLLNGLQAGDRVTFSVDNGIGGIIITKITKK